MIELLSEMELLLSEHFEYRMEIVRSEEGQFSTHPTRREATETDQRASAKSLSYEQA